MIYLDHSATTPVDSQVYEAMLPYLTQEYGNPSSKYYSLASDASKAVEIAREQVAKLIAAKPEEIIFTCGATESNNTIIKGVVDYRKFYENRGNHILTSKVEHHSVLNTCHFLNGDLYSNRDATFSFHQTKRKVDRGYRVTFLGVNPYGQVENETLEKEITPDTTLISLLWGNNEIGSINDISSLAGTAKAHQVFFHSDATQVLGKMPIHVQESPVDALSFSAHKLYGPKGVGAIYLRSDTYGLPPVSSLMHGGQQEFGVRGGTLAVANIVGFGKAAELAKIRLDQNRTKHEKNDVEILELLKHTPWLELVGDPVNRIPGVFSVIVNDPFFNNELFIKYISANYAISAGSACTAGEPSHVLSAIGRQHQTSKVLRISAHAETTCSEIRQLLDEVAAYIQKK